MRRVSRLMENGCICIDTVDKYRDTVDFLLRKKRDKVAAKAFFRQAFKEGDVPEKVSVDKSDSNKSVLDCYNQ